MLTTLTANRFAVRDEYLEFFILCTLRLHYLLPNFIGPTHCRPNASSHRPERATRATVRCTARFGTRNNDRGRPRLVPSRVTNAIGNRATACKALSRGLGNSPSTRFLRV